MVRPNRKKSTARKTITSEKKQIMAIDFREEQRIKQRVFHLATQPVLLMVDENTVQEQEQYQEALVIFRRWLCGLYLYGLPKGVNGYRYWYDASIGKFRCIVQHKTGYEHLVEPYHSSDDSDDSTGSDDEEMVQYMVQRYQQIQTNGIPDTDKIFTIDNEFRLDLHSEDIGERMYRNYQLANEPVQQSILSSFYRYVQMWSEEQQRGDEQIVPVSPDGSPSLSSPSPAVDQDGFVRDPSVLIQQEDVKQCFEHYQREFPFFAPTLREINNYVLSSNVHEHEDNNIQDEEDIDALESIVPYTCALFLYCMKPEFTALHQVECNRILKHFYKWLIKLDEYYQVISSLLFNMAFSCQNILMLQAIDKYFNFFSSKNSSYKSESVSSTPSTDDEDTNESKRRRYG